MFVPFTMSVLNFFSILLLIVNFVLIVVHVIADELTALAIILCNNKEDVVWY